MFDSIYEEFCLRAELELSLNKTQLAHCHQLFSDILDAMLEALKAKGAYMTPKEMKLLAPDRVYPYGWLVFILEEA